MGRRGGLGTVEMCVCGTALSVDRAAAIGAYAQALARYLRLERPRPISAEPYLVYSYNRFQACRYGMQASLIEPCDGSSASMRQDLAATFSRTASHAEELGSRPMLQGLLVGAQDSANDARRLRARLKETQPFAAS